MSVGVDRRERIIGELRLWASDTYALLAEPDDETDPP
jgi:hypothetical protein